MMRSTALEYGPCPCGGTYEPGLVEVSMTRDGEPLVLRDVPRGRCRQCGSQVYKAAILGCVEAVYHGSAAPAPHSPGAA